MTRHFAIDNRVAFAAFALASGLLSLVLLALTTMPAPRVPEQLMSYFAAHRPTYLLTATTVLMWSTVSVPFIVGLGALVGTSERALAAAAAALSAAGVLLLSFATFAFVGAFLSIAAARGLAPSHPDETYQAALWSNLSFFLTDPGLMTLGLGQLLFSWLSWKTGLFPRFISVVGYLGGVAGVLTLVVYQTSALALAQIAAFGVWGIATGVVLLRHKGGQPE
jgi:hypothetical protein